MNGSEIDSIVARVLEDAIPGFALQAGQVLEDAYPGIRAKVDQRRIFVKVKAVTLAVVEDVLARLSMGALEARLHVAGQGAVPMVAVVVPSLGRKVDRAAGEFMALHAPDVGWAVLDPSGNARIVVPALRLDVDRRVARVETSQPGRSSVRLFSDLNRWLLKVLLLADAPADLWGGPRQSILSRRELGLSADVSPEMVRRFANAFEKQDLLRQTPQGLRVIRRAALLDLWRSDEALDVSSGVPVRRLMGGPGAPQDLSEVEGFSDSVVVAGFEACRLLGVLHAMVPLPIEAHAVVPIARILERFDLERCAPSGAAFWLLPSRHPKSILRGSVCRDGLRVADGLQAAFDVLRHPARGHEQSEYLLKEVLRLEEDE